MPVNNIFSGKHISIIGDSISTLKGYLPSYCKAFYMQNPYADCSGISRPEDTWWMQVISALGGDLCVNNSYSGSLVCGMDFPAGTHLLRCNELHCNAGSYWFSMHKGTMQRTLCTTQVLPEVILVYMGTNDWIFRSAIDGEPENKMNFRFAYNQMLHKIRSKYPESTVVCTTLFQENGAVPDALHPISAYNEVIRSLAVENDCLLSDPAAHDAFVETIDGIHPTYQGMHTLAELWLAGFAGHNP